jgi:hypothetical protein
LSLLLEGGDIPSAFAPVRKWRRDFIAAVVVVLVVSWTRRRFGGGGGVGDGDGDRDVDFVLRIGLLAIEEEELRLRLRLSFGGDCGSGREFEGGVVGAADCLACQAVRCSNSWRRTSSSLRRSCGKGFWLRQCLPSHWRS